MDTQLLEKIHGSFSESLQIQITSSDNLSPLILSATKNIAQALMSGKKIIAFGEGKSVISAQLFVANLLKNSELPRPHLPSVLLNIDTPIRTAMMDGEDCDSLLLNQFNSIAISGDILVIFSHSKRSINIINLIDAANNLDIPVVIFTNRDNENIDSLLNENSINIPIVTQKSLNTIENHVLIVNIISELIEHILFPH